MKFGHAILKLENGRQQFVKLIEGMDRTRVLDTSFVEDPMLITITFVIMPNNKKWNLIDLSFNFHQATNFGPKPA